jgi:hypothetical protein
MRSQGPKVTPDMRLGARNTGRVSLGCKTGRGTQAEENIFWYAWKWRIPKREFGVWEDVLPSICWNQPGFCGFIYELQSVAGKISSP